jgi:uncharacterized protein (TIGR00251 family)
MRAMLEGILDIEAEGSVLVRLHVQPGAGRSAVVGRHGDALKIRVAAPPAGGRANEAVLELLAAALGVKASDLELVGGAASRSKRVRVTGVEPDDVRKRLENAIGNAGPGSTVHRPQERRPGI